MIINGYCTSNELHTHMEDRNSAIDEDLLQLAINAASRAIDKYCGRRFWQDSVAVARQYVAADPFLLFVDDFSAASPSDVTIKTDMDLDGVFETTWADGDFQFEPVNAAVDGAAYAYTSIRAVGSHLFPAWSGNRPTVQVSAKYGWSAVPDEVHEACLLKAAALLKRRESPQGVAGFGEFGAVRITRNDPDVVALLTPFRKVGV